MKKSILIFTLLTCLVATTFAAEEKKEEKWKKPSGSQICFVTRVVLSNNIDRDFYAIGLDATKYKDYEHGVGYITRDISSGNSWEAFPNYGNLGEFFQSNIAKKDLKDAENGFYLPTFRAYILGRTIGHFYLPANVDVTYPADAKYVYLGTFVYTINESDFTVKSVRRVDEYEAAKKALTQKLGEEVTLVRAELAEHKKVEKKK